MDDLDLLVPVMVNYNFFKDFGLVVGNTINNKVGFSPLAGLQHSFAKKKWVVVSIASFFLTSSRNVEFFGLYEFKPQISSTLALTPVFSICMSANHHARSFLHLRAGLKKESFSFGIGANLDQYGPEKDFKPNYSLCAFWDC